MADSILGHGRESISVSFATMAGPERLLQQSMSNIYRESNSITDKQVSIQESIGEIYKFRSSEK